MEAVFPHRHPDDSLRLISFGIDAPALIDNCYGGCRIPFYRAGLFLPGFRCRKIPGMFATEERMIPPAFSIASRRGDPQYSLSGIVFFFRLYLFYRKRGSTERLREDSRKEKSGSCRRLFLDFGIATSRSIEDSVFRSDNNMHLPYRGVHIELSERPVVSTQS